MQLPVLCNDPEVKCNQCDHKSESNVFTRIRTPELRVLFSWISMSEIGVSGVGISMQINAPKVYQSGSVIFRCVSINGRTKDSGVLPVMCTLRMRRMVLFMKLLVS